MSRAHDFVVVGGGPAGTAIAILLVRAGAKVALLEKDDYRGFRIGEHLHASVRGALAALGCDRPVTAGCAVAATGIVAQWRNGAPTFRPHADHRGMVAINVVRNAFDAALFERAGQVGVVPHMGTRDIKIERSHSRWTVAFTERGLRRELRTGMLIDASGRRSVVARQLGACWKRSGTTKAIAMLLPSAADAEDDDRSLAVEAVEDGWLSLTPRIDDSVMTFYTVGSANGRQHREAGALIQRAVRASQLIRPRIKCDMSALVYAGTWPAFPRLLGKPFGVGWFAIGEAAAAYDPVSGQGVAFALETAFRGAEMALSDTPLSVFGPIYQDAIAWRYEEHLRRRAEIYREAADQFRESSFWSQFAPRPW